MNIIWAVLFVIGILYGGFTGQLDAVSNGMLDSAREAITLCITMMGVMSFWTGMMEIGEEAGLVEWMSMKMQPVIQFLFPEIPKGHSSIKPITTNIIANMLGLGWAATPAGLQAMAELEQLEEDRRRHRYPGIIRKKGIASNEMCDFLILNISSLQLIPVNIIAYRSQYGSVNPAGIAGAGIAATLVSTLAGVLFIFVLRWKRMLHL